MNKSLIIIVLISVSAFQSCKIRDYDYIREIIEAKKNYNLLYEKQRYDRFAGIIHKELSGNIITLKYDSISIKLDTSINPYLGVFTSGLIYGQMFLRDRNDSMKIFSFKQLHELNKGNTKKVFKMVASVSNWINPHYYLIELTNFNATKNSEFEEFIKGAKVTFKCCWIGL